MSSETARDFVEWLVSLDEPGSEERRSVTLNRIIERGREALADEPYVTKTGKVLSEEEIEGYVEEAEAGYDVDRIKPLPLVGTRDDRHGGLKAVLSRELDRYGLPAHAGLTGLLRHLEGNRAMSEGALYLAIELLRDKLASLRDELAGLDDYVGKKAGLQDEDEPK